MNPRCQQSGVVMILPANSFSKLTSQDVTFASNKVNSSHPDTDCSVTETQWTFLAMASLISALSESWHWQRLASPWQPQLDGLTRIMCSFLASVAVSQEGKTTWACLQNGCKSIISFPVKLLYTIIIQCE